MNLTEPEALAERWFTAAEAAVYTRFSAHYIRDAANEGRLKGYRSRPSAPKSHWRFLAADLDEFVQTAALGPRWGRSDRSA